MNLSEDTKSIDSLEYDSMSITESLDGSPRKTKKKKRLAFFRKKTKEIKVADTFSVEKDTDQISVCSSVEASSNFYRQSFVDGDKNELNHDQMNGNGIPPQMTSSRKIRSSGSFNKKWSSTRSVTHHLYIQLRSGEDLAARDANGRSDPYVKFKVDGRTAYKSKVCKGTLNPIWDEEFQLSIHIQSEVKLRVYDKDIASRDDFMGEGFLDLQRLNSEFESITIELKDPSSDEELGYIHFEAKMISVLAEPVLKSGDNLDVTDDRVSITTLSPALERTKAQAAKESFRQRNSTLSSRSGNSYQHPVAVATLQLVSGSELPARDTNGLSDPYVKLHLGKSKRKSKVCYKTLNPVWKEEFTFYLNSPETSILDVTVWDKDNYRKDDFIGRCDLDLWSLSREETHSLTLSLVDTPGSLHVLVTVHAIDAPEVPVTRYDLSEIRLKYGLTSTFKDLSDIGFAEVRIVSASGLRSADLNGKSDPFCVAHLCNARAQTHTCYRTLEPEWNRVFNFPVRDIHDVFDFWIYDQDPNYEKEFLGRACIPILRCANGEKKTYHLKDKKLKEKVKGTVTVQISYIFNPVRAAIRTFSPREEVLMEEAAKFKKPLLTQNFSRVWRLVQNVLAAAEFINSCFTWQNKLRSALAFLMYLIIVWNFELYMLPVMLLMLLMKNYVDIFIRKTRPQRHLTKANEAERAGSEDDEEEEENGNKLSLLQKLRALEEVLTKVQVILDRIASLGERVYNTFAWSVPFLGWLLVIVLIVAYIILYFIPLRVIILLWGINKFTKRLRKPNYVSNNEVMDYLSRIPSNIELDQHRQITPDSSPTHSKKKR